MNELLHRLLAFFRKPAERKPVWLIDRDGRVYLPTRRVVLRGASAAK